MENSLITYIKGEEKEFKSILAKINNIDLPITTIYQNGYMHFLYQGMIKGSTTFVGKCDGNTAHSLDSIITGLWELYKN